LSIAEAKEFVKRVGVYYNNKACRHLKPSSTSTPDGDKPLIERIHLSMCINTCRKEGRAIDKFARAGIRHSPYQTRSEVQG
jgi:hypothetical protein